MTDPYNTYSYTSAPEISDILCLNLSVSFSSASPPWQLLSTDSSPALAWHTLSAFNTQGLLLFGGQPGPNSETVLTTLNDSAALLSVSNQSHPSFLTEPQNWASEPMRRMRHSTSSIGGRIWIVGGEKADGSGNAYSDHYVFDPSAAEFNPLPSGNDAPPDIYGHASLVLPDGKLVVLGGCCASCAQLVPMSTVWSLDTTQNTLNWQVLLVSNSSLASPRRDFSAVVLSNGNILIHGGGDAQLETTYSDGWILDTSQIPMVWQNVEVLAQVGPRKDHFAIQTGGLVLFGFGYGSSSPASPSLLIYDPASSTMVSSYTVSTAGSTPAINSLPAATQTSGPGYGSGSNDGGGGMSGSSTSGNPATSGPSASLDPSSGSNHHSTTAIALGTTFGILGLVAGGLATAYYVKRVRDPNGRTARRFFLLGGVPEVTGK
ncbi:hypothetical protein F5I97DRAFT_47380 [Phlebopus sp. FC_14]|nr:hypothetical protein F5I97DRAFT_47380 [Phlebopus sp. FC_14]